MAYIQPDGIVQFYDDLGLSPNYENTLYFETVGAKDSYFDSLTPITTATALTYSRAERGFIRVEKPMSTMINVGYMRFKNSAFENKWFYAFVKNVEYINNITTQVNFELDVMMTWMGTFHLAECYVERQHTLGDEIGANIAEEDINYGEYITEASSMTAFFGSYKIGVYRSYNPEYDAIPSQELAQGTYAPLIRNFYSLDTTGLDAIDVLLYDQDSGLVPKNRIDEVINMKLVPEHWDSTTDLTPPTDLFSVDKPYHTIGGGVGDNGETDTANRYVPRNKKLFVFPYKYLEVENCEGESTIYKYEYFNSLPDHESTGVAYFQIMGTSCTPEVNIMCTPKDYNGEAYAWDDSISMKSFPNLAWNVDMYKAYLAQRDSTIFGNIAANAITAVVGGALTGAINGGASGMMSTAVNEMRDKPAPMLSPSERALGSAVVSGSSAGISSVGSGAKTLISDTINSMLGGSIPARFPSQTRGSSESNLMVQSRNKNFYFRCKSITKNYAMMIDDFFDMYGYAIKQRLVPNMNARPYWTYVKTIGCTVHGNLPADDGAKIESIFDSGVRFWKNHNHIGMYRWYNNAPT